MTTRGHELHGLELGARERRDEQPQRGAEHGVGHRDHDEHPDAGPATSSPSTQTTAARPAPTAPRRPARTPARSRPRKSPLPVGIASSRSRVPEDRSRSVVTDVTRNITMNGISASSGGPSELNPLAAGVAEHPPQQRQDQARQHEQHRQGPVVAPQLGQDPRGDGAGDPGAHAAAPSTSARNASSTSVVRVRARRSPGGLGGEQRAVPHQQQPVAALGLVHHVAGDQHRRAVVGEPVEHRPQVAPQHRVETDRRLVEDQQLGAAEQRHRERDPRPLATGEPARRPGRGPGRGRRPRCTGPPRCAATPSTRAKKRRFSATVRSS